MRIVVKVGGAQLEQDGPRAELAAAVRKARDAGHELVLVHGGGMQIRAFCQRLSLAERWFQGLRVTDAATAEVVAAVLAGLVNKQLVQALTEAGVPALGMCGADDAAFTVHKLAPGGVDLGFVGEVHGVRTETFARLLGAGFVPTVATVAPLDPLAQGDRSHLYNVNADLAAGPLAAALGAKALLFLTDVPGVLDAQRRLLPRLTPSECARLRAAGVITGGMLPKVDAALAALARLEGIGDEPGLVKIAPAGGKDAVRRALSASVGTLLAPDEPGSPSHG